MLPRPAKSSRVLWIAAGLAAVFALSAFATMRTVLASRTLEAPSLVGARPSEAYAAAARMGLRLTVDGRRHDPTIPAGVVCAQEPAPGNAIKSSRALRVIVSLGPRRVSVPAVAGRLLREARVLLDRAGLSEFRVVTAEDITPEGTVILQDPPPGEVDARQPVRPTLLVSRGPASADYVMPDLIGRPAAPVLAALQQAGLRIADLTYREYPGAAPGVVLKQSPQAGFRVTPRTIVTVEVNGAS